MVIIIPYIVIHDLVYFTSKPYLKSFSDHKRTSTIMFKDSMKIVMINHISFIE